MAAEGLNDNGSDGDAMNDDYAATAKIADSVRVIHEQRRRLRRTSDSHDSDGPEMLTDRIAPDKGVDD